MKDLTIAKTKILRENGEPFFQKWFSQRKEKSFICHVDTLYYMITPNVSNYKEDPRWLKFVEELEAVNRAADNSRAEVEVFKEVAPDVLGLGVRPWMSARMYALHFGVEDVFDVFVCNSVPNQNTPPIMIQCRSNALWIDGMKNTFDKAYDCVAKILAGYGIDIVKTQENRIDYAFHTNYINDFMSFFPEKDLGKMFVGGFKRGRKEYEFHTHEDDANGNGDRVITSDYFTLGRHKSNNVFFRAYNKTQEVIEMGYKQFFIAIWLKYGLISKFDEFCLLKAFTDRSYKKLDRARCEFYYTYGTNEEIKNEIGEKLQNADTPASWFTKRAKGLVPAVTIISNVELQTKRKFYDRKELQEIVEGKYTGTLTEVDEPKRNIYDIFEQMSCIIKFLTDDTVRFVKYKGEYAKIERTVRPMADWWERLRRAKFVEIVDDWEIEYLHLYQHNLDYIRGIQQTISKKAKNAAYVDFGEGVFHVDDNKSGESVLCRDFQTFFSYLNDNDFAKYKSVKAEGFKEIKKKLRQNAISEAKRANRPPPKPRKPQLSFAVEDYDSHV